MLERKHGITPGLGRRLPSPEGSDQETLPYNKEQNPETEGNEHESKFDSEEETQDFYRLERSASADSEEPENDLLKEVGYPFQVGVRLALVCQACGLCIFSLFFSLIFYEVCIAQW